MADAAPTLAEEALHNTSHIPIAQLTPLLAAPSSRSINAIVTLIWPYSSVNNTLTVGLAEPDFRLRRTRGQVRVQFSGSSAKRIVDSKIGSGDQVLLSLDGAEWVKRDETFNTPGRDIEWELKYSEKLVLEIKHSESRQTTFVSVDHPEIPERAAAPVERIPTPEPISLSPQVIPISTRPAAIRAETETGEYSSPAFIKRARVSYGSLFDTGLDIFAEEDGYIKGRGRKKARFSSGSRKWRYSSRSPSAEADVEENSDGSGYASAEERKPTVVMTDEGCQTDDIEDFRASVALADNAPQATAVAGEPRFDEGPAVGATHRMTTPSRPAITVDFDGNGPVNGEAPLSPRLQPIPSDGLPLVSPLTTRALPSYEGQIQGNEFSSQGHPAVQELFEDALYPVEPATHQNNIYDSFEQSNQFQAQQDLNPQYGGLHAIVDAAQYGDQYGRWQGEHMTSIANSPFEQIDSGNSEDGTQATGPYYNGESTSGNAFTSGEPFSYPDLTEASVQPPSGWGADVVNALYPHMSLPTSEPSQSNTHTRRSPLPSSVPLQQTRSQSAHSAVVDLTESSDEETDGQQEAENMPSRDEEFVRDDQRYAEDNLVEEGFEGDEEEPEGVDYAEEQPEYDREEEMEVVEEEDGEYDEEIYDVEDRSAHIPRSSLDHDRSSQQVEDDESVDEQYEEERGYRGAGIGYDEGEEDEEDEEEEEDDAVYDEDEEYESHEDEAPAKLPQPSKPVVIDLLTDSDEEDEPRTQPLIESSVGNQDEKMDDDGDGEEEEEQLAVRSTVRDDESEEGEEMVEEAGEEDDDDQSDEDMEEVTDATGEIAQTKSNAGLSQQYVQESSPEPSEVDDASEEEAEKANRMEVEPSSPQESVIKQTESIVNSHVASKAEQAGANEDMGDDEIRQTERESSPGGMDKSSDERPSSQPINESQQAKAQPDVSITQDSQISEADTSEIDSKEVNTQLPTPADTQVVDDATLPIPPSQTEEEPEAAPSSIPVEAGQSSEASRVTRSSARSKPLDEPSSVSTQDTVEKSTELVATIEGKAPLASPIVRVTRSASVTLKEPSVEPSSSSQPQTTARASEPAIEKDDTKPTESHRVTRASARLASVGPLAVTITPIIEEPSVPIEKEQSQEPTRATRASKRAAAGGEVILPPPTTPIRASRRRGSSTAQGSPTLVMDEPTVTQGHDASAELAATALLSPTKAHQTPENASLVALQKQLSKDLKANLPEYAELKAIRFFQDKKADILAVATTASRTPEKAKKAPKHWYTRFCITDNSTPSSVSEVQVFRPHKEALPIVEAGDMVLLRRMEAKKDRGGFNFRSVDDSAWVVFKHGHEIEQIRGPPVEFGDTEREHVAKLGQWWDGLGEAAKARIERANKAKEPTKA